MQQASKLGRGWPGCPVKRRACLIAGIHAVKEQHVEVDVQVQRRTESLDEGDCTGLGAGGDGETGLLDEVCGDRAVDNAKDLA